MICESLQRLTTWPCAPVRGAHGESITMLSPPVPFWDGSVVPMFIIDHGEQIEMTDDGGVLHHLDVSGFKASSDKRRRRGLEQAVARWNASFEHELQVWCKPDELAFGLQRYMCAMFAVAHWEANNAGKAADATLLAVEAETYLTILNPTARVEHDVKLMGISGRARSFPLRLDDGYYDAVGTHHSSSAQMVRKLFDVRSIPYNQAVDITVIVDDRHNEKQAREDIATYSQLAFPQRFSELRTKAEARVATRH